jgi:hypothetical protein
VARPRARPPRRHWASTSTRAFDPSKRVSRICHTFPPSALCVFSFLRLVCLVGLCRQDGTTWSFKKKKPPVPLPPFHVTTALCAMSATEIELRMCMWCTESVACSVFGGLSIFLLILLLGGAGHTSPIKIWGHIPRLDASDVVVCGYLSPVYLFDVDRCTHASQKKKFF